MRYSIVEEEPIFIQNGSGNAKYAMIRSTGHQFIINNCCEYIIKEILSNDDTETVLSAIKEKYNHVPEKDLRIDFNNIVNMLSIYNAISLENGESRTEVKQFAALGETEYQEATDMIHACLKKNKFNVGLSFDYYSAINMRSQIMNNNEYYYRFRDEEGKIRAILSIIPNLSSSVVLLNTVVFDESIEDAKARELLSVLINTVLASMTNRVNKIRLIIAENNKGTLPYIGGLLEELGFAIEAVLKNEIGNKSVYYITKDNME